MVIGDAEVLCICPNLRLRFLIHGFLGCGGIGKRLPLTTDLNGYRVCVQSILNRWLLSGLCWGRMLRFIRAKGLDDYIIWKVRFVARIKAYGLRRELRRGRKLCMSFFIGIISVNTKIPALLQIIDSGTVIGKAITFHGSGNIPLCRLFRFCQRFVIQPFIEAVFNVVIDYHLIPRFQVFRFHHRFGNREAIFRNKLSNTALYLCPG